MKPNMFKTLALASVVTISGAVLPASAAERLHVSVPFSFIAGGTKMPAGDYNLTQSENGVMTLAGTKNSAMFLTVPSEIAKGNAATLSFTSGDNAPVLTAIQISGSMSREIPVHATERKAVLASAR